MRSLCSSIYVEFKIKIDGVTYDILYTIVLCMFRIKKIVKTVKNMYFYLFSLWIFCAIDDTVDLFSVY